MIKFEIPLPCVGSYLGRKPSWGPVGEIVYKRTYEYKNETWPMTVKRVVEGCYSIQKTHCDVNNRPWNEGKALASALEMYDLIYNFKFTPPGRGLDCMRFDLIDKKGCAVLNNCGFVSTEDDIVDAACWLMDMLALGVGVGFDTLGVGQRYNPNPRVYPNYTYVVDDTREGWVACLKTILQGYFNNGIMPGLVDYSKIRPKGSPLDTIGGTASGPGPLVELVSSIHTLAKKHAGVCNSEFIVDLMNLIGRCIVAGNKRRSAEIAFGRGEIFENLKNPSAHPEFIDSGTGNWSHPSRWASNNSCVVRVGQSYSSLADRISHDVELGVFWLGRARAYSRLQGTPDWKDTAAKGSNPCAEQTLHHKELCCLVETYPSLHEDYYEFQRTLKYAYLYAKSVSLGETHCDETNQVIRSNRRIGTSISGVVPATEKHGYYNFVHDWCPRGYEYIQALDDRYSTWFAVNRSIKTTSVKPSGTVSKLCGVTPGVHWPHSEFYFNVIRFASDSPYVEKLRTAGYRCVDLDPNEPNTTAVYFAVREEDYKRSKSDVPLREKVELVAQIQAQWSDNQVSATFDFSEEEAPQIQYILEQYETRLKSATFLKRNNGMFAHMPLQEITEKEYWAYIEKLKPVLWTDEGRDLADKFCDGEVCDV